MDATTNIKARLPGRHVTEGPARAPYRSYRRGIEFALFDGAGVFKKTPYIADSKPVGRDVAKDIVEVGGIPLPTKTPLDHGFLHGDCVTVTGRTIAENLKSVKWTSNQDVARSANDPITVTGGVVVHRRILAPKGILATETAIAVDGAVTRPGGKAGKVSHADA
jgi:dihydroxy-acid dehydratase